jgi:uncharacterized BrkB/YihY/UPF0761 family membrane protein
MLTEKEEQFIRYWEADRELRSTFMHKLLTGLPMAAMFALPILLFIMLVYIFLPDWYAKISGTQTGSFVMAVVAVLICIIFFAYFRMHFKWEMNEQLYQELKQKQQKTKAANGG